MNTETTAAVVRWTVIGYRVSVYQACQGAPVQPGGCCDRCGQGIKYVYRVKSSEGVVMEVGSDCAITLEGGPELAELRAAEREWERQQYLASPEYAAHQAEAKARREREAARAAAAEVDHALTLTVLRAIRASANCSDYDKDSAQREERRILAGEDMADVGSWDNRTRLGLSLAARAAYLPASSHAAPVGKRIDFEAVLEALIPLYDDMSPYGTRYIHRFRDNAGRVYSWFTTGGDLGKQHVGCRVAVRGTVKAHKEYKGEAQTSLSRCKTVLIDKPEEN